MRPDPCRTIERDITEQEKEISRLKQEMANLPPQQRPAALAVLRAEPKFLSRLPLRPDACTAATAPQPQRPPVTMSKAAADREVYLAVAATAGPDTDVLAGIVRHVL